MFSCWDIQTECIEREIKETYRKERGANDIGGVSQCRDDGRELEDIAAMTSEMEEISARMSEREYTLVHDGESSFIHGPQLHECALGQKGQKDER